MTSGLLNSLPEDVIPYVLAHECGHIVCHHCLYSTMGRLILSGAASFLGLSPLVTMPLQMAFFYWMRCSEFSADRAAAVYGGSADGVVEFCLRMAGFDKNIPIQANKEAFIEQAKAYHDMVKDSAFNKTLEFMMFSTRSHPLNAVRAYEANEWCKTDSFKQLVKYLDEQQQGVRPTSVPMNDTAHSFVKKNADEVMQQLKNMGFTNVSMNRSTDERSGMPLNGVVSAVAGGRSDIKKGEWLPADIPWVITAYLPLTDFEQFAAHPGQACVPYSDVGYCGRDYRTVVDELRALGFTNITVCEQADIKVKFLIKEYSVAHISIDHNDRFEKNSWFNVNAPVVIRYHVMAQN